jgi:large subunit ribosomal protein L31
MKDGIHPEYREVAFKDIGADHVFIVRSTLQTRDKITLEGKEYPLVNLDISSKSHPFYTGKQKILDTGGRVDKFKKRYSA